MDGVLSVDVMLRPDCIRVPRLVAAGPTELLIVERALNPNLSGVLEPTGSPDTDAVLSDGDTLGLGEFEVLILLTERPNTDAVVIAEVGFRLDESFVLVPLLSSSERLVGLGAGT